MDTRDIIGHFSGASPALLGLTALLMLALAFVLLGRKSQRPLTLPLLGDVPWLASNPVPFLWGRFKRYGPCFTVNLMGVPLYLLTDPAVLRGPYRDEGAVPTVPFSSFRRLMEAKRGRPYEVFADQHAHGPWRRLFVTAVGPLGLESMLPHVVLVMESHLREWEAAGNRIPSVFRAARLLGLDLALDVVAGVKLPTGVDRAWFKEQALVFLDGLFGLPLAIPGSSVARALAAKERLVAVLEPMVQNHHEEMKQRWKAAGGRYAAVADRLLAEGGSQTALRDAPVTGFMALGDDSLRAAAVSMLHTVVAAADTTRFALFNSWALVAMSPRVQDKLSEEQQKVLAEYGPQLSLKALAACPYLEATLKEAMRLLPATPGSMRRLTTDLRVSDQLTIPKGSMVWLFVHLLHCVDPVLWDGNTDCDVPPHMDWRNNFEAAFRPERWLSEDTKPKHYFTFGSGNHMCPGQNLAYMELKAMLALVMRKYRLRLQTPDALARCKQMFPFIVPSKGTDTVMLVPREVS